MTKKVRVGLWGFQKRSVMIDAEATEGATIGEDLKWADGTTVTESEIINPPGGGNEVVLPSVMPTLWGLILDIPKKILALVAMTATGFVWHENDTFTVVTLGSGTAFDWPLHKNYIGAGQTLTIPVDFQYLINEGFDIEAGGVLDVDAGGLLVVMGDHPGESAVKSPDFTYDIGGALTQIDYPTGEQKLFTYNVAGQLEQLDMIHDGITTRKTFTYVGDQLDYITEIFL